VICVCKSVEGSKIGARSSFRIRPKGGSGEDEGTRLVVWADESVHIVRAGKFSEVAIVGVGGRVMRSDPSFEWTKLNLDDRLGGCVRARHSHL